MSSWISVFLVAVFAVVHTAAASSADEVEIQTLSQKPSVLQTSLTVLAIAGAHQMKCCEQSGNQYKSPKVSNCSVDCVTFIGTRSVVLPKLMIAHEQLQPPPFNASNPSPDKRPPRHV